MRHCIIIFSLFACLLTTAACCRAESASPLSIVLGLDARTNTGGGTPTVTQLYDRSLNIDGGLGSDWSFSFYGIHRYGRDGLQKASVEKDFGSQRVQVGVIRLPFGIYDERETYGSGLIDYPLARTDYMYNSVDWGVPGAEWEGGSAKLQIEAAGFGGYATGDWNNHSYAGGGAVRLQTYSGNFILGASRWDGFLNPYLDGGEHKGVHLSGLDLRYSRDRWMLRGEYILGELAGDHMSGGYLDAYYRLPHYEQWSLVARIDMLKPESDEPTAHQTTVGMRYVAGPGWVVSANWQQNNLNQAYHWGWTPYSGAKGDLLFQIYHTIVLK